MSESGEAFERAIMLHRQGEFAAAEQIYREVLHSEPEFAPALCNLGATLLEQRRAHEALPSLERARELDPANPVLLNNLGNVLGELGRTDDALRCYDIAVQISPAYGSAHSNRSSALLDLGQPLEALQSAERAVELQPDNASALNNLGKALAALDRHEDALGTFNRVVQLKPDWQTGLVNRSSVLLALKRPHESLCDADEALRCMPADKLSLQARGSALRMLQRFTGALHSFEAALAIDPGFVPALCAMGMVSLDLGRASDALAHFDRATRLLTACAEAHYGRGLALMQLGRLEQAAGALQDVVDLQPEFPYALGLLMHLRLKQADWRDYEELRRAIARAIERKEPAIEPFCLLAFSASGAQQLRCARSYACDRYPAVTPLWQHERYEHERIRVAYLSGDFGDHPVSYLMAGVLEQHDRVRFEVTALSSRPLGENDYARRITAAVEHCIRVDSYSDGYIASLIRDLEIDILVDLMGYTQGTRFGVLSHRPAPLQLSYLGYPGTTGSDCVDYLLADCFVAPPADSSLCAEPVIYLPRCFQAKDALRALVPPPNRREAGLPDAALVLCCFNASAKITPEVFEVWCRLLRDLPGSILWLLGERPSTRANLQREAQARDIDPERLVFASRLPYDAHLSRLQLADLFLDTYPFNAGSTASDALRAGVPVVTCSGEAFASRMAGSLLHAIGLSELVTESLDEYARLVRVLGETPNAIAALKSRLALLRSRHSLFDPAKFCRGLEQAYRLMLDRQADGLRPTSFAIES